MGYRIASRHLGPLDPTAGADYFQSVWARYRSYD